MKTNSCSRTENDLPEGDTQTELERCEWVMQNIDNACFVFGSNLSGKHGLGAAKTAREKYGAIYGQGKGRQGKCYALPTKDAQMRTLPLSGIADFATEFILYAQVHPDETFFLTRVGCGLAGYSDLKIAPLFAECPPNVIRPQGW